MKYYWLAEKLIIYYDLLGWLLRERISENRWSLLDLSGRVKSPL